MKISHITSSTIELNNLMPFTSDANKLLTYDTPTDYENKLIISDASNRKRFDVIDSIFNNKQSIYSQLSIPSDNYTNRSMPIEDDDTKLNLFERINSSSIERDDLIDSFHSNADSTITNYLSNDSESSCERKISNFYIDSSTSASTPNQYNNRNDFSKRKWNEQTTSSFDMQTYSSGLGRGPYVNRYLSLSISPPLSRRQEMPVLRGSFVSL